MDKRLCTSDFVINNLPAEQRQFLSRKSVQDAICEFADVKIYTRGHYIKPRHDGFTDTRPPLSLHIVGHSKRNISLANQKIHSLLMNPEGLDEEEIMSDTEKITVGIDVFPTIFGMKTKILGENNENAEYILNETGAIMTLRGKGSGFIDLREKKESEEPLHVHVRYKNMDRREKTRELILNLIDTVQQDFIGSTYGKYYSPPRKPEIIPVLNPTSRMRRTSSYNSLSSRSPVRINERSNDRRSVEDRGVDSRIVSESRPFSRSPESRPFESRSSQESRPYENRAPDRRSYESRAPEPRVYESRHSERSFESRTSEPKPYDSRPAEPRHVESRIPEPRPHEERPFESRPFVSRTSEPNPFEKRPSEPRSTRETRFESRSAESKPFESRPTESRSFGENRPAEPRLFENRPAEPKPYESRPVEPKPYESRPAEPKPYESRPAEPKPYESRPAESRPFENRPAEPVTFTNRPAESRPFENRSDENPLPDSTTNKTTTSETTSNNNNIEKITIGIESVPPNFNLKSKIYGPNLANVKHIEKVASALLLVEGKGCGASNSGEEAQDAPHILVKYLKPDLKETARHLIFNLIETIQQEYITLYGRYPGGPQKPKIVPIKKLTAEKPAADSTKVKRPPADVTPVPPPPPVISKTTSPPFRFDSIPLLTSFKPPSPKLFANAEPTPVPRPVQPVVASTTSNAFLPSPFQSTPELESLPVPAPLTGIGSQSSILNSVLSTSSRLLQPGSFATPETSQAQIQTIQYSEKRPKSPVESVATEPKRFCSAGVGTYNSTVTASSVPAPLVTRGVVTAAATGSSAKSKNAFRSNLIPINVSSTAHKPINITTNNAATTKTPPLKPVPPPAPVPAPNLHNLPQLPSAKKQPLGILKKPQWNNTRNGGIREKSDSEDEGRASTNPIILSDSEDEELTAHRNSLRISATVSNQASRDISVQTDDKLYQTQIKNIKCACGRFMHVVTGVRSVETQTIGGDSYRRF